MRPAAVHSGPWAALGLVPGSPGPRAAAGGLGSCEVSYMACTYAGMLDGNLIAWELSLDPLTNQRGNRSNNIETQWIM